MRDITHVGENYMGVVHSNQPVERERAMDRSSFGGSGSDFVD